MFYQLLLTHVCHGRDSKQQFVLAWEDVDCNLGGGNHQNYAIVCLTTTRLGIWPMMPCRRTRPQARWVCAPLHTQTAKTCHRRWWACAPGSTCHYNAGSACTRRQPDGRKVSWHPVVFDEPWSSSGRAGRASGMSLLMFGWPLQMRFLVGGRRIHTGGDSGMNLARLRHCPKQCPNLCVFIPGCS